uniref:UDP-glucuronosyltransferase n=1 Tax=Cacopsylla melanoneura TaxID=428564 RepID=A0A8D8W1H0_9HEMI
MSSPCPLLLILVVTLVTPQQETHAAHILVIAPLATHSHAMWFDIVTTLLAKEHQITVISSDPEKRPLPNRTTYELENSYDKEEYINVSLSQLHDDWTKSVSASYRTTFEWNVDNCQRQSKSKGLAKFIDHFLHKAAMKVDLIIRDGAGVECYLPLVHLLNYPPVISATPFPVWEAPNQWIANYDNPAFVPHSLTPYSDQMSFLERLHNLYITLYFKVVRYYYYLPAIDTVSRDMFPGHDYPHVNTLDDRVVLAFVNYHPVLDYPKPLVPAFIPVPGLQLKPARKLPQDFQSFLDGATDGALIFTFGSSLLTANMSPAYRKMFFDVFRQLKQRVLWKWEMEIPADKPANVMLANWLPQADILGHPNTVAFISHCGQAGSQEAIYHGVPVLAIPLIIDQIILAAKMETKGVAIQLKYEALTEDAVRTALDMLITPRYGYKQRMRQMSAVFRDTPHSSADKIVYWTNYILQHGGSHLTPVSKQLTTVEYYLIDVLAFVIVMPLALVWLTKVLMCMWCGKMTKTSSKKIETKEKS